MSYFEYAANNKSKNIHSFGLDTLLKGEMKCLNEELDSEGMIYKWKLQGSPGNLSRLFSSTDRFNSQPLIGMTNAKGTVR